MADMCGRGHLMVGDNVGRKAINRAPFCRACARIRAEAEAARKRLRFKSSRKPKIPLDADLAAELRARAGTWCPRCRTWAAQCPCDSQRNNTS
jgi:hypothetical protein